MLQGLLARNIGEYKTRIAQYQDVIRRNRLEKGSGYCDILKTTIEAKKEVERLYQKLEQLHEAYNFGEKMVIRFGVS